MGSSAKKKREKKKDFQKAKLKVGKTKPKAANHTVTSFKSKAIVLNQQSLTITAPSASSQFGHHVLLLTSKSDSQRRESLAYLTTFVTSRPVGSPLPQPVSTLLPKLYPLILDGSSSVRTQLLKLFRSLPPGEMEDHVNEMLPYVRAGMTHLAAEIRLYAVDVLCWLLEEAGSEVVSCAGGWHKTLNCFLTILGWSTQDAMKWSSNRANFGKSGSEGRPMARTLQALAEFVHVGIGQQSVDGSPVGDTALQGTFPMCYSDQHQLPPKSNAFGYLNLFGMPKDDATEMLEDLDDRRRVFDKAFRASIEMGLEAARKEGGDNPTTTMFEQSQHLEIDPGKAPRHAMSIKELEYPNWEYHQQQNGEQTTTEDAMTMKTLSIKLTRDYPKVTKLIPSRPNAKKWETTMAAVAQVMAFLKPGEIGEPNTLIFPAVLYDTDKRKLERKEMDDFNKRDSKFLTLEVIHDLETVWHVWRTTIDHASAIGAQVYQKKSYGPPNSIPWIEFIGIAVIVTNHYILYGQHHDLDTHAMTWVLSDVSRLRRWLRCKLKSDGFRRNDADWKVCWDIIEPGAHDKEIPRVSVFKESKTNQPFVFEDELELFLPRDGNPESVVQNSEDMDVEMAGSKEVEEDEGEDRWEENLHPGLRGVITGSVVVEKHDLIGSTPDTKKAEARREAWGWLQPREPAEPSNRFYPVDDTQFYQ